MLVTPILTVVLSKELKHLRVFIRYVFLVLVIILVITGCSNQESIGTGLLKRDRKSVV